MDDELRIEMKIFTMANAGICDESIRIVKNYGVRKGKKE